MRNYYFPIFISPRTPTSNANKTFFVVVDDGKKEAKER